QSLSWTATGRLSNPVDKILYFRRGWVKTVPSLGCVRRPRPKISFVLVLVRLMLFPAIEKSLERLVGAVGPELHFHQLIEIVLAPVRPTAAPIEHKVS